MFYIWHTLLITAFVVLAYGLGYRFGKTKYKAKKVKPTLTLVDTWSDKETSHKDWLTGYHKWKSRKNGTRRQTKN